MRFAVPLVLVAAVAIAASVPWSKPQRPVSSLRFLPSGGGQSSITGQLCDVFGSELTGSWWCMYGDTTTKTGSQGMSAIGSPTTPSHTLCPNGPNCASVQAVRTNGTSQHVKTVDVLPPTGDFSMVWVGTIDTLGAVQMFVAHDSDTPANNRGANLFVLAGGEVRMDIFKTDGASTAVQSAAVVTQRATHVVIGTYDFVADGTSVGKVYLDGVEVATTSTAVGPVQAGAGTYWSVGERELSTGRAFLGGSTIAAMMTEKVLSPTTIASMSNYILGTLGGSFGQALTFARTSAATCIADTGLELSVMPAARPCVTKQGLRMEPAATNLALRSEEMANAAWANVGTPVLLSDIAGATAPDGSKTVDSIQDDSGAAFEGRSQAITTSSQVKYTFSCWVQTEGLPRKARFTIVGTGNAAGDTTCDFTSILSFGRQTCTTTAAYGAGLSAVTVSVLGGNAAGDTTTLDVWGCQLEAGSATESHATSYIRTAGGTVTRSAETNSFTNPLATADSSWCIAGLVNNVLTSNVNSRGIVGIGTFAANNTALLRLEDTTKFPQAIVFDNAGAQKIITHSTVLGAGLTHLRFCNANGTLTMYRDGASVGSVTGAGTGVITTMPGTVTFGINGTSSPFEDTVSDFCIGRGPNSCALGR